MVIKKKTRIILNKKFTNPNTSFKQDLNLSSLTAGLYILNVRQGPANVSKKIIKY